MKIESNQGFCLKQFYRKGFQVFPKIISESKILHLKEKLLEIKNNQNKNFSDEELLLIGEKNTIRSPFLYDKAFIQVFYNDFTRTLVKELLGDFAILSLQNCIFMPKRHSHHQSFYHRDLIYQNFTSSVPLAINLYCCLTDYFEENGGTNFIVGSHREHNIPETYQVEAPTVEAGSYMLFDSMTFHKAGANKTDNPRIGINNMYTLPFIKQQISYPNILKKETFDERLNQLLGFKSREFLSVDEFRNYRLKRVKSE